MKYQYGHILTLVALSVATHGSSIEDALGGMTSSWDLPESYKSQLLDELSSLDSYPTDNRYDGPPVGQDYQYHDYPDYDLLSDKLSAPTRSDSSLMNADVPKTSSGSASGESQDNQGFRTNTMLPAYCDPPNPCPIGYTTADGCIEDFENSSEFSRGYQSRQKCICDTEHMFDCPEENAHRGADDIAAVNILAEVPGLVADENNPYLGGQKLPVAAKKGNF